MVDYNNIAKKFSGSRKGMIWGELEYFFDRLGSEHSLLDIGCGNGRLLEQYLKYFSVCPKKYLGVDLSSDLLAEAKLLHPNNEFICADMRELISTIDISSFTDIFMIASFHHIDDIEDRINILKEIYNHTDSKTKIYMTNWNLLGEDNSKKYADSKITKSENEFGSCDFSIKFGDYQRYYHAFSLEELRYIAESSAWKLEENRVFENERNIISILSK